jgi:hypothetical protein
MKKILLLVIGLIVAQLPLHADLGITPGFIIITNFSTQTNAQFVVSATNAVNYQWRRNGTAISGATQSIFLITNVTGFSAANYSVKITNSMGVSSISSNVTLDTLPEITNPPDNKTNSCGTTATFSVYSDGSEPRTWLWYSTTDSYTSGTNLLDDQTTYFCSVSNVQPSFPPLKYFVVITNNYGSVTSLLVTNFVKPSATVTPLTNLVAWNSSVTFTAVVECAESGECSSNYTYQWYVAGGGTGLMPGETNCTLTVTANYYHTKQYKVKVSNAYGSDSSPWAKMIVIGAPEITNNPVSITTNIGARAVFTAQATGAAPLIYRWHKNSDPNPFVTGVDMTNLVFDPVHGTNAANYFVSVTNYLGSDDGTGTGVTLRTPPHITIPLSDKTTNCGANVTFTVGAKGSGPLEYHWYLNGVYVGEGTSNFTFAAQGNITSCSVVVSNNFTDEFGAPSSTANLYVLPMITRQPANLAVCTGSPAIFSVGACGPSLAYQWRLDGSDISGATTSSFTNASASTNGAYSVRVSSSYGTVTSGNATLTVTPLPTITTQPASQTVGAGTNAVFTVVAGGTPAYQWKKNGVAMSGETTSTLTLNAVNSSDEATYTVLVSNGSCGITSSGATLTLLPPPITLDGQIWSPQRVELYWTTTLTNVIEFQIERNGTNGYEVIATNISASATNYSDTNLNAQLADEFYYRIAAIDSEEQTIYSNEILISYADSDEDFLPDAWEIAFFGDLSQGALDDFDGDQGKNGGEWGEYLFGTDPTNWDTDGDGISDDYVDGEGMWGTDPLDSDTDDDGLPDGEEVYGWTTDPTNPDPDEDGLSDFQEIVDYFTNPWDADTDGDSYSDYDEIFVYFTDPNYPDP